MSNIYFSSSYNKTDQYWVKRVKNVLRDGERSSLLSSESHHFEILNEDSHLQSSDIVVLFLSSYYLDNVLSSSFEVLLAGSLNKGVTVFSLIVDECDWQKNKTLVKTGVFPDDYFSVESISSDDAERTVQNLVWGINSLGFSAAVFSSPEPDTTYYRMEEEDSNDLDSYQSDRSVLSSAPSMPMPKSAPSMPQVDIVEPKVSASIAVDPVEFSVFTSSNIQPNSKFIVDVWAYLSDQYDTIVDNIEAVDRSNRLGGKEGVAVPRGTVVSIQLEIEALEVEEPIDSLMWYGIPSNVSFIVNVPENTEIRKYSGKATISYQGIKIAKVLFIVPVTDGKQQVSNSQPESTMERVHSAFASYSSKDRAKVIARLQGISTIAPDLKVFFDIMSLRAGDNWKESLEENIRNAKQFLLFWSDSAAESKWVEKEWRMALKEHGLSCITPVPLEEPDFSKLPEELKSLHFNDRYLAYINQYKKSNA